MPLVSVTLPNDGDEALVEPYNAAINAILGVINGQIDSSNILAGSIPWSAMSAAISNAIPASAMQNSGNLEQFRADTAVAFVSSGMVWSVASGLTANMSAGIYYSPNGVRNTGAAVSAQAFTASKDTYVDFPANGGSPSYTAVANNAASPSLATNYIRVAIVVTGASSISSINQGGVLATAPVVNSTPLSISDSLGNLIYNTNPYPKLIGYRYLNAGFTVGSGTGMTAITGLAVPVIIPLGRSVKASVRTRDATNNITGVGELAIYRGTTSGTQTGLSLQDTTTGHAQLGIDAFDTPGAGAFTYTGALQASANNVTLEIFSYIAIELE